jgi:carboxymethylenebutenolidase
MGEKVTYRSNGGTSEGYLAVPADGGPAPAVIVIQEWWGLVDHIRDVCERFARAGFVALAPDLYEGATTREPDEAGKLLMGLAMDQAAREIAGAADMLVDRADTGDLVGVVGFSAGGSLALWSATASERIVATVGFYPVLPWERMRPQWTNYTGKSALVHACETDGLADADGVRAVREAIESAGGTVAVHDYPGTRQAFFNDDRPEVYDTPSAARAWARTIEHFRHTLKA